MRQLVTELRAEQPPPLDWERVDGALGEQVEQEAALRRRRAERWQRNPMLRVAGFAAVAAGIALVLTMPSSPTRQSATPPAEPITVALEQLPQRGSDAIPTYSVSSLASGSTVESNQRPVRFVLDGVATWTLGPNSRAVLRTVDMPHVVSLERGSLHAQVVPRGDDPIPVESFAVETGGTRVAVHGTVFSVVRSADEVTVEVTRGTVAVGPAGHRGLTTGHLLVAPSRAAFSLDGGRQARLLPAPQAVASWTPGHADGAGPMAANRPGEATDPAQRRGDDGIEADTDAPAPSANAAVDHHEMASEAVTDRHPEDPAADAQPALSAAQAQAAMTACLGKQAAEHGADDSVRVTISSTVRLRLDAQRRVISAQFSPPLKPELQQRCAATVFGRTLTGTAEPVEFAVAFRSR